MFGIHVIRVEGEMILPVKLLMKWEELAPPDWNWALEFAIANSQAKEIWDAELVQSVIDWDFRNQRSCSHWACVTTLKNNNNSKV